jgi:hypothetical protein
MILLKPASIQRSNGPVNNGARSPKPASAGEIRQPQSQDWGIQTPPSPKPALVGERIILPQNLGAPEPALSLPKGALHLGTWDNESPFISCPVPSARGSLNKDICRPEQSEGSAVAFQTPGSALQPVGANLQKQPHFADSLEGRFTRVMPTITCNRSSMSGLPCSRHLSFRRHETRPEKAKPPAWSVSHIDHMFARMLRLNTYEAKTNPATRIGSNLSQVLPPLFSCE